MFTLFDLNNLYFGNKHCFCKKCYNNINLKVVIFFMKVQINNTKGSQKQKKKTYL